MIPYHVYYQLVLLGLLGLCVMLHYIWPSRCAVAPQKPAELVKPPRQRSHEPKPFGGLTRKPHCALCEQEAVHPKPPPPVRPAPMPPTDRRPCAIDTSRHFCPHAGCDYRGWLGLGNLRANGHPSGGLWRQFYCRSCHGYFLETHGTLLHGKHLAVELIVRVLACLAEGLGIRATARVFEVHPNTPTVSPAIPGGRPNPVTTPLCHLAFRKHGCDNMPLKEMIERWDDLMSGGCDVHRGTERT